MILSIQFTNAHFKVHRFVCFTLRFIWISEWTLAMVLIEKKVTRKLRAQFDIHSQSVYIYSQSKKFSATKNAIKLSLWENYNM